MNSFNTVNIHKLDGFTLKSNRIDWKPKISMTMRKTISHNYFMY